MITLDLRQQTVTIDELLEMGSDTGLFIFTKDGKKFLLKEERPFDGKVSPLVGSDKFMPFLAERSKNKTGRSLDEVEKALGLGLIALQAGIGETHFFKSTGFPAGCWAGS